MDIAVALDRASSARRDLTMFAGDDETINLTVYRVDGDDTPLTTEVQSPSIELYPDVDMSFPVGAEFTVPDKYDRVNYRLKAEIDGNTRTLCAGTIWIRGGVVCWPYRWDYGFLWGGA
jgi:hypothetical protein